MERCPVAHAMEAERESEAAYTAQPPHRHRNRQQRRARHSRMLGGFRQSCRRAHRDRRFDLARRLNSCVARGRGIGTRCAESMRMGARTAVRNHGLRHGAPSSRSAQRRRSTACVARTWWSLGTLWHVGCILSSQISSECSRAWRRERRRRGAAHWGLAPCSGTIRSSLITRSAQCKCPWPMPHFTLSGKPVSLHARYLNSTGGSSPIKHGRAVGSS